MGDHALEIADIDTIKIKMHDGTICTIQMIINAMPILKVEP